MQPLREALRELPETVFADLLESEDAFLLVLDLPGATGETTEVTVSDGKITVDARREKAVEGGYRYLSEGRSLFLDAELPLPPGATDEGAEATMERGVLELRLPKRTGATEQSIPID
ncbi:MAG: Hsp20/alpha crystallin family protein [Haloferacaceae archaeon]